MGRPRKTKEQYMREYWMVLDALRSRMPYRKIAERFGVGISTVQRLAKMDLHTGFWA